MSRYFFVIRWLDGRQHDDVDGAMWPNDADARKYAERIIRELKASGGYDDPGLTMVVQNAEGETVFEVSF